MNTTKTTENRIRRKAARIGWRLYKARGILHSNNHGLYQLVDDSNTVRAGVDYDLALDDAEAILAAQA